MQNARIPGQIKKIKVLNVSPAVSKNGLTKILLQPSITRVAMPSVRPMMGASQNSVAGGLLMPMFLLRRRSCVRPHRRPPSALADVTNKKPLSTKWVWVATMRRTPAQMRNMTPMSRHENISSLSRKANRRTKTKDDDLHIADVRCENAPSATTQNANG